MTGSNIPYLIVNVIKRRRQLLNISDPNPATFCPANGFPIPSIQPKLNISLAVSLPSGLQPNLNISLSTSVA